METKRESSCLPLMTMILLAIFAVLWCAAFAFYPCAGQDCLFFCNADTNYFFDFFTNKAVAQMPAPYVKDCMIHSDWISINTIRRLDQCYPALANYWVRMFPDNLIGAMACASIGMVVYVWGLIVFFDKLIPSRVLLSMSAACCSAPFLFSFCVANLILYAAGFSLVFLAWHDSNSYWRRVVAGVSLAMASVIKVSPVLLGLLYLRRPWKRNLKDAIFSAAIAVLLFVVPFVFCGGVDSLVAWMDNAAMNSSEYAGLNKNGMFGLISVVVNSFTMRELPDVLSYVMRVVSLGFGVTVLVLGCMGRRIWERQCLVVLGMLFIPPTMMRYTYLYLIPFVITGMYHNDSMIRKMSAVCCLSICMLMQLPLWLGPLGSLNFCVAAASTVALAVSLSLSIISNCAYYNGMDKADSMDLSMS